VTDAASNKQRAGIIGTLRAAGCVFAEGEADLLIASAATPQNLKTMVERRTSGEPLEHIVGWAQFCDLRVEVDPGVFVPRHRTELLVRHASKVAPPGATVVDLCCGSGAVGAAIAAAIHGARLFAVDIDPAAVQCARRNLSPVGAEVFKGDLYTPLPPGLRGRVDVLVANVPYVPTGEVSLLPPEARLYEPRVALDGGPDGLDMFRRVASAATAWLAPGGHLLVETSAAQSSLARDDMSRNGLASRVVHSEELDATAVIGRWEDNY